MNHLCNNLVVKKYIKTPFFLHKPVPNTPLINPFFHSFYTYTHTHFTSFLSTSKPLKNKQDSAEFGKIKPQINLFLSFKHKLVYKMHFYTHMCTCMWKKTIFSWSLKMNQPLKLVLNMFYTSYQNFTQFGWVNHHQSKDFSKNTH